MTNDLTYKTAVRNIQRYLRAMANGSDGSEIFAVPIDGIFDTATEAALSEFQRRRGFPVTGTANKETFDALYLEYLHLTTEKRRKTDPDLFPTTPESYSTEFGEQSSFISVLQFVLDEIRLVYDTLPNFEMNGTYDADTALAVKEFQRIHGLPITGRVDRSTWNEMANIYNQYARYAR